MVYYSSTSKSCWTHRPHCVHCTRFTTERYEHAKKTVCRRAVGGACTIRLLLRRRRRGPRGRWFSDAVAHLFRKHGRRPSLGRSAYNRLGVPRQTVPQKLFVEDPVGRNIPSTGAATFCFCARFTPPTACTIPREYTQRRRDRGKRWKCFVLFSVFFLQLSPIGTRTKHKKKKIQKKLPVDPTRNNNKTMANRQNFEFTDWILKIRYIFI